MSFLANCFRPYTEYTLSTTLSREQFFALLRQECSNWKDFWFAWETRPNAPLKFHLKSCSAEQAVLIPLCKGRNSLRGLVHCKLEEGTTPGQNTLHVLIKPHDWRLFYWCYVLLLGVISIIAICGRTWHLLLVTIFMFGGLNAIVYLCRIMGEKELPQIKQSLEWLLRKLENTPLQMEQSKPAVSILDWFTYILNLVVAAPVAFGISCCLQALLQHFYMPLRNISKTNFFLCASCLTGVFLFQWGLYQYRMLILKQLPPPEESDLNRVRLYLFLVFLFLLLWGLLLYVGRLPRNH
ncbi:MAG: hypothetical protein IJJ26_13020 [Victivallales bacterium]|nr:hypothetical protein [Victivallales bacterium]